MGIPAPSSGSVTEDQGVVGGFLTTSGDIDFFNGGDDSGVYTAGTLTGTYGTLVVDEDGVWTYTADNSNPSIQALDTGETLTDEFAVESAFYNVPVTITINGADEPPCFTAGTLVDTPHGPRPVESLRAGDFVRTGDNGVQCLRWVGRRRIALNAAGAGDKLRPIRLRKDAIAPGVPARDIVVSPMHRVLVGNAQTELMFGQREVLAAARHLVNGQTVVIDPVAEADYVHLLFDRHEIVTTAGLRSESFYPGGVGLAGFEAAAREEVFGLFPELRSLPGSFGPAAREVLKRHEAEVLARAMAPAPMMPASLAWAA